LAGAFFAGVFFTVGFLAGAFLAAVFLAAEALLAGAFLGAAALPALPDLAAGDFFLLLLLAGIIASRRMAIFGSVEFPVDPAGVAEVDDTNCAF
jgi:hypothetical protein